MQRSSESIANLASALAKAQIELVNPEKSLVGTIYPEGAGKEGRSFNYASLANGLDIVRKTLGQHEIAVMQTTAVDQPASIVNLTTLLAHSSGEWIASDWPVCTVAETATPHRMGAALTYARRYALFTLVGIAGEDDLDAPDLQTTPPSRNVPTNEPPTSERPKSTENGHFYSGDIAACRSDTRNIAIAASVKLLASDASATLRDRLIAELKGMQSTDDAALWARRSLREKNTLINEDAQSVEQAFQAKLVTFTASADDTEAKPAASATADSEAGKATFGPAALAIPKLSKQTEKNPKPQPRGKRQLKAVGQPTGIDKGALTIPEPRRIRDREHIRHVARQACLVCGRTPCDAHHLRFTQSRALGRKVSDEFTVPLCRGHHREAHSCGDEAAWWGKLGIDPIAAARALWLESHPLPFRQGQTDRELASDPPATHSVAHRKGNRASPKRGANYGTKAI